MGSGGQSGYGRQREGPFRSGSRRQDADGAEKSWEKRSVLGRRRKLFACGGLSLAPAGVVLCQFITSHARDFLCETSKAYMFSMCNIVFT